MRGPAARNFQPTNSLPGLRRSFRAVVSRQALLRRACGHGLCEIREAFALRGVVDFRVLTDAQHALYPDFRSHYPDADGFPRACPPLSLRLHFRVLARFVLKYTLRLELQAARGHEIVES